MRLLGGRVRQEIGDGIGDALDAAGVDEVREQTLRTLEAYEEAARAIWFLAVIVASVTLTRFLVSVRD